ncbi:MAG: hypothetical protein RL318_1680 [Fibrobacterota bacterium]|jgi:CHASE2 domain-containing sensor protein/tRNA A-37 threonylcarbamoyl transferase component Bud32
MKKFAYLHAGLTLAVLGLVALRPIFSVNRLWQDKLAAIAPSGTPSGEVVVVGISDADIQHFGPWPWDRAVTAKLFASVAAAGPKVMAFDGFFPHRSVPQPGDSVLLRTLAEISTTTKVILPFQFSGVRNDPALDLKGLQTPVLLQTSAIQMLTDLNALKAAPLFRSEAILWGDSAYQVSSAPAGHIHSSADPEDGTYRRNLFVVRHGDDFIPSVVVSLLAAWKDASLSDVSLSPDAVRVKDLSIPLDRYGYAPLRWLGPPGTVPTVSASQVIEDPKVAEKLKGKIVVIGVTTAAALNRETGDFFRTPVADRFPGVEIWGVALENALQGTVPVSPAWLRLVEIALGLGIAGGVWFGLSRKGWGPMAQGIGAGALVGCLAILVLLDRFLAVQTALDLPLVGLVAGLGGVWAFRMPRVEAAQGASGFKPAAGVVLPAQAQATTGPDDGKKRIGKFEIVREIGRGAMGVVYDGYDEGLDRHAAIKVIAPERRMGEKPEESLERFKREARAIAALNHPSIVTIYESGEWQESHYIAMEFLRGKGLDELMVGKRFSWREIHDLGGQILAGLGYAHSLGVVHRDIKPANIMVVDDGRHAKLTDFGLARKGDASMSLTQEGTVLGTPYYMAPEQVEGKRTDAHSDQFSLGLVFFEMLAGCRAYDGEDVRSIMLKILLQPPKDLAPHLEMEVPTSVLGFMETMLEKEASKRFPTLEDALKEWNRLPV